VDECKPLPPCPPAPAAPPATGFAPATRARGPPAPTVYGRNSNLKTQNLKAVYHVLVSSAELESRWSVQHGCEVAVAAAPHHCTGHSHCSTSTDTEAAAAAEESWLNTSSACCCRDSAACCQELTLVHISDQRKHILWTTDVHFSA
jgi:hypothetical protein